MWRIIRYIYIYMLLNVTLMKCFLAFLKQALRLALRNSSNKFWLAAEKKRRRKGSEMVLFGRRIRASDSQFEIASLNRKSKRRVKSLFPLQRRCLLWSERNWKSRRGWNRVSLEGVSDSKNLDDRNQEEVELRARACDWTTWRLRNLRINKKKRLVWRYQEKERNNAARAH